MPNFFVEDLADTTVITGDDARHIARSLRMKPGEKLTLCDNFGRQAEGRIVSLSGDAVTVRLGEVIIALGEPSTVLTLYLCLPKGDKADLVVQKSAELGVSEVVLVLSDRCVSRPDAVDGAKKVTRLQKIAREASMQSGRGRIVNISSLGGMLPWPKFTAYCVSKAGVIMLTRCLARALAPEILVNSVAPGTIQFPGELPDEIGRAHV